MLSPKINLFSISSLIQFIFLIGWRFQVILWKTLGWLTKLGYLMFCYLIDFKVLAFSGLGEIFKSSLATENPSFQQLTILCRTMIIHRNLAHYVICLNSSKRTFGGLGELSNSSLATEKLWFRQLNEGFSEDVNHWKQMRYFFGKGNFRWLGWICWYFISHRNPSFQRLAN